MADLFGDSPVNGTDFSSMEAHFEQHFAEIRIYWKEWVGQKLPCIKKYMKVVREKSLGVNLSKFKDVDVEVMSKLMSGDCSTSSDNFVLDLCIIFFLCSETKYPQLTTLQRVKRVVRDVKALFEGDDGIFTQVPIAQDLIDRLGVNLKLDKYDHFSEASFCGLVADPVTLVNTTDPRKVLADFGVMDPKYGDYSDRRKYGLMRSKAMSYAYQFRACPVVTSFSRYVLRATKGQDVGWTLREVGGYHRQTLRKAQAWCGENKDDVPLISAESRTVVERHFGLSVDDQIACEAYFDSLDVLQPIQPPCSFPELWCDHAEKFVLRRGCAVDFPKDYDVPEVRRARRGALRGSLKKSRWCVVFTDEAPLCPGRD
jgi:hypothetical protein